MSGCKSGGLKCYKTNIEKYGDDYYKRIGTLGGKHKGAKGFASEKIGPDGLTGKERARKIGMYAGKLGKRGKKMIRKEDGTIEYITRKKETDEEQR